MSRKFLVSIGLALATAAAYWPVLRCGFVNLDDDVYVTANPAVVAGLTRAGVAWALTATRGSIWMPLTWIAHMLDVTLWGANPAGHHLASLVLHVANTVALFLVLRRATGTLWRSAAVAALFALHPLRVESVAWVAERKDVLSTFCGLLAIAAYLRYTRRPTAPRLALVALCLTLGLLAKPMLVTLPVLLLLLDVWPLRRGPWRAVVREKLPLLVPVAGAAAMTVYAANADGGLARATVYPVALRLANAIVSYVRYVGKALWPLDLAAFYPYPAHWPARDVAAAALVLAGASAAAVLAARRRPWVLVGWLWFVLGLGPAIGLLQSGSQAMADRYLYLPLVGLFVVVVWGAEEIAARLRARTALGIVAVVVLAALGVLTHRQVGYWRSSEDLFRHAIAVTGDNWLAETNLGDALVRAGRVGEAVPHLETSLRLEPRNPNAHYDLGVALAAEERTAEAIAEYEETLGLDPSYPNARNNLGLALLAVGRTEAAVATLRAALGAREDAAAHYNLALALARAGDADEAVAHYEAAIRLAPAFAEAHYALGRALAAAGRAEQAHAEWAAALRLRPDWAGTTGPP